MALMPADFLQRLLTIRLHVVCWYYYAPNANNRMSALLFSCFYSKVNDSLIVLFSSSGLT